MRSLAGIQYIAISMAALVLAVCGNAVFPAGAAAEMLVKLKDGRVLSLPVDPGQVDSITYGPNAGVPSLGETQQPVRRAADQLKAGEKIVLTSRDAEQRAPVRAQLR